MKKLLSLLAVALLGGLAALGIQKYAFTKTIDESIKEVETSTKIHTVNSTPNYNLTSQSNIDFTIAAEKSLNAVVHVKNVSTYRKPQNPFDLFTNGGQLEKAIVGAGSGVIISEDGYIVTNNHVIKGASEVKVTLNNAKTYDAQVIGTEPNADIALLKIETNGEALSYLPFGNSDNTKIGEWVLAVGNPFNLTSTVTAGIISAKARDLNEQDGNIQSFIQTDAAINPGNSGGALVNTHGELIGINTAISSQTGSYIGYGFAVTSNNARKIVEDILEYGDVQKAILGITGGTLSEAGAQELGIDFIQGVFISSVNKNSGAFESGLEKGDIITQIDGYSIKKFADLTGYVNSKRPNDVLSVTVSRNGNIKNFPVKLTLFDRFVMSNVGLEVINASESDLQKIGAKHGVIISQALTQRFKNYRMEGIIITEIDNQKVSSVSDVRKIMKNKDVNEDVMISFLDRNGEKKHFVFN